MKEIKVGVAWEGGGVRLMENRTVKGALVIVLGSFSFVLQILRKFEKIGKDVRKEGCIKVKVNKSKMMMVGEDQQCDIILGSSHLE